MFPDCVSRRKIGHYAEAISEVLQELWIPKPAADFQHDHTAGDEFAGVEIAAKSFERIRAGADSINVDITVREDQFFHKVLGFLPLGVRVNQSRGMPDHRRHEVLQHSVLH